MGYYNNYDREDITDSYNQRKEKVLLTREQKIDFIAHCDIQKTKEEILKYKKELETKSDEEINLLYTKLNKEYWKMVRIRMEFIWHQQNVPNYDSEETRGPTL